MNNLKGNTFKCFNCFPRLFEYFTYELKFALKKNILPHSVYFVPLFIFKKNNNPYGHIEWQNRSNSNSVSSSLQWQCYPAYFKSITYMQGYTAGIYSTTRIIVETKSIRIILNFINLCLEWNIYIYTHTSVCVRGQICNCK